MFESGALYDPKVLDIKDEDLLSQVMAAVNNVAAISLELSYPTLASIPHSIINGYKNVLAVAVETDYSFDLADKVWLPLSWLTASIANLLIGGLIDLIRKLCAAILDAT